MLIILKHIPINSKIRETDHSAAVSSFFPDVYTSVSLQVLVITYGLLIAYFCHAWLAMTSGLPRALSCDPHTFPPPSTPPLVFLPLFLSLSLFCVSTDV